MIEKNLITRWDGESALEVPDELAREEPLEIRVRGRALAVTMRTPGADADLAAGFLLSEGIIHKRADIDSIEHCRFNGEGNVLNVYLDPSVSVDFDRLTRHVFGSSSCGVCGKATIDSIHAQFPPVRSDLLVSADLLSTLPDLMRASQSTFDRTGGLHAAALFDPSGRLLALREDVGRHNAVDKLLGHSLLAGPFPLDSSILLVSGRASFEILQKSLSARIPIVASVSAPSSLAVDFASQSGQTLIGFLRARRLNVYSHPRRVSFVSAPG